MSKKKLLSESQVRRFMGLAGLSPINENYMDENMYEAEEEMPEEDPMAAMAGPEVGGEEEMPAMGMEEGMEEGGGDELAMILEELGVSPEELAQAIEAEEAGAGGAPDMGGEMAPAEDEVAAEGMEVEASAKQAAAKSGQVQENLRDYITELVQRSRH